MKKVYDPKVSKRPIEVYDDGDMLGLRDQADQLDAYIASLEKLDAAVQSQPGQLLIAACYRRLRQIERRRMFIPVEDVTAHASAVGQWNECLRITLEQIGDDENFLLTNSQTGVKTILSNAKEKLAGVRKRMEAILDNRSKTKAKGD